MKFTIITLLMITYLVSCSSGDKSTTESSEERMERLRLAREYAKRN